MIDSAPCPLGITPKLAPLYVPGRKELCGIRLFTNDVE